MWICGVTSMKHSWSRQVRTRRTQHGAATQQGLHAALTRIASGASDALSPRYRKHIAPIDRISPLPPQRAVWEITGDCIPDRATHPRFTLGDNAADVRWPSGEKSFGGLQWPPSFSLSFHDGAHSVAIEKENIDGLCACCASTSWPWEGWVNIPRFATTLTEVSVPSWEKFRCLVWKLVSSSSSMRDAWTSRLATRMFSTVISYVSLGFWIECYKEYCCNFVFFIGILNWML